ncbi:MAG: site-specific integrase [Planctomycetota bacterium]|nr:site-specific integrase [Planctomycetota bacterium]
MVTTVEELESIRYVGGIIPQSLNEKITKLSPDIRDKLFDCGLLAERNPITVKDLFENFISYKLKTADPRSVRNYRSTLNTFQDYVGADTRIDRVTVGELKEFLADLNGKKEPSTIANYIKRTSAAFAHAVDNDWITYSPFTKLKEKRAYQVKKSEAKKQAQEKLLTIDVINKLLTCRKIILDDTENREWNSLTWVLRWTGCRIGEACILRWEDIDFDGNQISMRGKRKGVIGITSTDMRIRLMPFWKPLRPLLEDLKANSKSSFLFNKIGNLDSKPEFDVTDKEGNVLKHGRYSTNLQTTFKKILKRNELEAWPAPFHAIRSFRINELERDSRYRTVEVREWTGNSEQVAAKFYSAVTADDRMKAAQD